MALSLPVSPSYVIFVNFAMSRGARARTLGAPLGQDPQQKKKQVVGYSSQRDVRLLLPSLLYSLI